MTEIIYDTHLFESGPWLLPEASLVKLDEIVNAEWESLNRRRQALVERQVSSTIERRGKLYSRQLDEQELAEIKEEAEQRVGKSTRRLKIFCQGGKSISATTFAEAFRSPEAMGERPKGFALYVDCADIHAEIELQERTGAVDLSIRPVEASEARELFVELRRWVLEFKPPTWQRIWKNSLGLHWVIWGLAWWLSSIVLSLSPDTARQATMATGQQLLVGGLNDQEVRPAVEVLLKLAVVKGEGKQPTPSWFKVLFFGGLGMCILLSFPPKSSLAIGEGRKAVKFWQRWAQLVGVTLPIFLFGTFAWPSLESFIRGLF